MNQSRDNYWQLRLVPNQDGHSNYYSLLFSASSFDMRDPGIIQNIIVTRKHTAIGDVFWTFGLCLLQLLLYTDSDVCDALPRKVHKVAGSEWRYTPEQVWPNFVDFELINFSVTLATHSDSPPLNFWALIFIKNGLNRLFFAWQWTWMRPTLQENTPYSSAAADEAVATKAMCDASMGTSSSRGFSPCLWMNVLCSWVA